MSGLNLIGILFVGVVQMAGVFTDTICGNLGWTAKCLNHHRQKNQKYER